MDPKSMSGKRLLVSVKKLKPAKKAQITNLLSRMKNTPTQDKRINAGTKQVPVPKLLTDPNCCGRRASSCQIIAALYGA